MNNLFKLKGTSKILLLNSLKQSNLYNSNGGNVSSSTTTITNRICNLNNNNNNNNNNVKSINNKLFSTTSTNKSNSNGFDITMDDHSSNNINDISRKELILANIDPKVRKFFFPTPESEIEIPKKDKSLAKGMDEAVFRMNKGSRNISVAIKEIGTISGWEIKHTRFLFDSVIWSEKNKSPSFLNFFIERFANDFEYLEKVLAIFKDNNIAHTHSSYPTLLQYYMAIGDRESTRATIEKLVVSNKLDILTAYYIPLIEACLYLDDHTSALAFYSRLLQSPLRYNYKTFYQFIKYYLDKDSEEGANSAVKFFLRYIKSVPLFVNTEYFSMMLGRLITTYYTEFFGRQHVEEILTVCYKRGYISNDLFYYNIIFHFIQPTVGQYDFAHQLYVEKISKKRTNTIEVHLKTIKYLCQRDRLEDMQHFLETFKFSHSLDRFEYYSTWSLLEFAQKHSRPDLYPLIFKHSDKRKLYLVMLYAERMGNQELLNQVEQYLASQPIVTMLQSNLSLLIQSYLALDSYHMALFWFSKKLTIYKSVTSPIMMSYFINYHSTKKNKTNKEALEFWESHLLMESLVNDVSETILSKTLIGSTTSTTTISPKGSVVTKSKTFESNPQKQIIQASTTSTISSDKQPERPISINEFYGDLEQNWKFFESYLPNPLKFSDVVESIKVPFDHQVSLACTHGDVDQIIDILLKHFENSTIPTSWGLIRCYCKVAELDLEKYVYLLNMTPPHIRNIIYDPRAYRRLLEVDPELAVNVMSVESLPILSTHTMFNNLLEALCRINHIDLASMVIAKIIGSKKRLVHAELFLETMLNNKRHNDPIVSSLKDEMVRKSSISPVLCNIEIMKLIECESFDEAFELFYAAPKNSQSLLLGLQIFSKKYPIPPVSNLMYWGSLLEVEKSMDVNGRSFFEYFYQILYENNLSNIVLLYANKSGSFSNITAKELHYILLSTSDNRKRIEIFNQFSGDSLPQETFKLLSETNEIVRNSIATDKLSKISIITPKIANGYKQLTQESIEFLIYNFTPFLHASHEFKIDNNSSFCSIYLNEKDNNSNSNTDKNKINK